MNHIYRIVWNQTKACWQAVCETANGHPRGTSSRRASGTSRNAASVRPRTQLKLSHAALLCGFGLMTATVGAAPTGGQVSAGTATISQSGATTTIQQASQKAAIDWTGFSVGKTESVRFNQPNASAITLNRVTGTERSEILGSLSANGQVFILNPNGVLFGKGAQVNVGGIVASTLRMSNEDFMAGNLRLTEGLNARASVSNEGEIRVAEGCVLALIAPVVTNTGTLAAPQGSVLMAAADAVSVTLQDGSLVSYTLDKGNLQALVDNGGVIHAEGGHVVLTAKGLDALSKAVVNHSGIIEAQTVATKNGVVELLGDMELGQVNLSGRVDASAPSGGNGGFVETSAAKVTLSDEARISTVSALGKVGKWLLDPTDLTIAPSGGDLTGKAVSTQLASNDVVLQSAMGTTTGNGDIFVNDRISWSSGTSLSLLAGRNIQINAEINASGNGAGVALNTGLFGGGQYVLGAGGRITLSGANPEFAVNGENYRVIQTLAQLQAINDDLLGRYVLGTDINASATSTWNGGKGFQPIGQGASNFMGVLDGLGHQVSGLYINRPTEYEVGLIGSMEATVRNIGVERANVTGLDQVGVLAGQIRWGSSVSNSYATGSVKGRGNVGGLIGFATPYHSWGGYWCGMCISIDQSYADVNVVGENVGGLIATIDQTYVRNSYAKGDVSGNDYVGGLVGHNFHSAISDSYAVGKVQGQTANVGGLTGVNNGSLLNGGHFDSQTTGQPGGNTTAEMKQQATFSGWDFNGVWRIVEGSSYPILRALTQSKITLTAAARDVAKVYNKVPWFGGGAVDYSGFAGTDSPSDLSGSIQWGGTSQGAIDVGLYTLIPSGLYSQKYEIDFKPATLYIAPRILDVSVSKPYDGSGTFNTGFNVKNVLPGDTVNITGEATVAGVDAGAYTVFTSNTLSTGNKNYTLNPVNTPKYSYESFGGVTATIDPITISGVIGKRVYDGTLDANWHDVTELIGVLAIDQGKISIVSGKGTLGSPDHGERSLSNFGDLRIGGDAAKNYNFRPVGGKWEISQRPISISLIKDFDGSPWFNNSHIVQASNYIGFNKKEILLLDFRAKKSEPAAPGSFTGPESSFESILDVEQYIRNTPGGTLNLIALGDSNHKISSVSIEIREPRLQEIIPIRYKGEDGGRLEVRRSGKIVDKKGEEGVVYLREGDVLHSYDGDDFTWFLEAVFSYDDGYFLPGLGGRDPRSELRFSDGSVLILHGGLKEMFVVRPKNGETEAKAVFDAYNKSHFGEMLHDPKNVEKIDIFRIEFPEPDYVAAVRG
jgi:filamentous hemagglutinin family protein